MRRWAPIACWAFPLTRFPPPCRVASSRLVSHPPFPTTTQPWKALTYKFLTTIIDDLFAFVVKMPTLHRIAVFRDDVM
jgi:hypothetical protein